MSTLNYKQILSVVEEGIPAYIRFKGDVLPVKEGATYTQAYPSPLAYSAPSIEMNTEITDFEKMVSDYFSKKIGKGNWYPELAGYRCQLLKLPYKFSIRGADLDCFTIPHLYGFEVLEITLYLGGAIRRRIPLNEVLYVQEKVEYFHSLKYRRAQLKDGSTIDIMAMW